MVFKKIIFQNRYVALETPSRPPPPFMVNTILNFHFDYRHPSLRDLFGFHSRTKDKISKVKRACYITVVMCLAWTYQTRLRCIVYNDLIMSGLDFHIITIVLDAKIWGGAVGVHPETKACRSISCLEQIFYRAQVLILLWAALVEHQPHFIPMLFCTLWVCIYLIKCYLFTYIYSVYSDSVLKCHL